MARESLYTTRKARKVAKPKRMEDALETQLTNGDSGDCAAGWIVVRDGIDPSTSGFSDQRSIPSVTL